MNGKTADDHAVVRGFLAGSEDALAAVRGWVRASASPFRRRLGEEWEDCVQDCLLRVTRSLRQGRFRGESGLATYVWRVAGNTCISRLRRRRPAAREILEDLDLPSPGRSPLEETLRREFRDVALEVWRRSSEDCRGLWEMILEGASYREMSERTGVSEGTLRVRVLRCRRAAWALRSELLGGDGND